MSLNRWFPGKSTGVVAIPFLQGIFPTQESNLHCRQILYHLSQQLFSCQVMPNSSQPQGLQHARPPCPLPSPRVCPSSCPLYQWCHPAISSSVTLFSFCLQSCPASGSFPMSRLFTSSNQSFSISPSSEYSGLISLLFRGFSRVFSNSSKAPIFQCSAFFIDCLALTAVQDNWKDHNLAYTDFCCKMLSFLFNTLSRFVIAFPPRSNHLLISWLQSPFAVILDSKKRKSVAISTFSPSICHWWDQMPWS